MPRLGNGYDHDDKFKQRDRKQCLGSFCRVFCFALLLHHVLTSGVYLDICDGSHHLCNSGTKRRREIRGRTHRQTQETQHSWTSQTIVRHYSAKALPSANVLLRRSSLSASANDQTRQRESTLEEKKKKSFWALCQLARSSSASCSIKSQQCPAKRIVSLDEWTCRLFFLHAEQAAAAAADDA